MQFLGTLLQISQFFFQAGQALFRGLVFLFFQRFAFDLQLHDLAVDLVQRLRLGIDLRAQAGSGFIDQVDGLVGQVAVRDVAVGERRGGDDSRVGDAHAVMDFIAFLQAAQDADGIFHARFFDQHRLETALQGRVFLDVFAILVQRGGADHVQFTARQHGLEHVAGVHRAFGLARANHGVHLVHEQQDLAV